MAAWDELRSLLMTNLGAQELTPGLLAITVPVEGGRTVTTYVSSAETYAGELWLSVDSVVASMTAVDLNQAARLVGASVCGGLAQMPIAGGDYLVVRHAMPANTITRQRINDLLMPIYAVSRTAFEMGQQLGSENSAAGSDQLY